MKRMVVIPARGGSKGIPGKNIKKLNGKPLIQYTINSAREVFDDSEIIVSTDDIKIKNIVETSGLEVPFIRPDYLATDNAGTYEVLLHAVDFYENIYGNTETLILLQPTSPFRTSKHIKEALDLYYENHGVDMIVSVCKSNANPYYNLFEENTHGHLEVSKKGTFTRRQDCPEVWEYNGAIYIINIASLKKYPLNKFRTIKKYKMSAKDSVDLDTPLDWLLAETLIHKK